MEASGGGESVRSLCYTLIVGFKKPEEFSFADLVNKSAVVAGVSFLCSLLELLLLMP